MRLFKKWNRKKSKSAGWGYLEPDSLNFQRKAHYWVRKVRGLVPICGNRMPHAVKQFGVNFDIKGRIKCGKCLAVKVSNG